MIQSGSRIITASLDLKCCGSWLNSLPQGTHGLKIIETAKLFRLVSTKYFSYIIFFFGKIHVHYEIKTNLVVEINFLNISYNSPEVTL